jgi:very-short-patch-repair endonuclease
MTLDERRLWYQYLRFYPVRILRQKVIGEYVVDFYCAKAKLVIEVDGGYHEEGMQKKSDEVREEALRAYGVAVMRVANEAVETDFDGVCQQINAEILSRLEGGL